MHEAVRDVEPASAVPRGHATRTSPPLVGVRPVPRPPLPPPRRTDPREAFRAATAPASRRAREPYLIVLATFAAASAIAVALFSSGAAGLRTRSATPATAAAAGLAVTAVDPGHEVRELRELARAAAAAVAAALAPPEEKNQDKKAGPAPSAATSDTVEEPSSPGPGATTGNDKEPTLLEDPPPLLEDSTTLVADSANELEGSATELLKDSTALLEDTAEPLLEEARSLELDPSLP